MKAQPETLILPKIKTRPTDFELLLEAEKAEYLAHAWYTAAVRLGRQGLDNAHEMRQAALFGARADRLKAERKLIEFTGGAVA